MACLTAALLLVFVCGGEAASLRASPQASTKPAAAQAAPKPVEKEAPVKASQAIAEQLAATITKALAANVSAHAGTDKAKGAPATGPVTHQKLDVGFADFEKNLTEEISAKLLKSASGTPWNDDMRTKFSKDVTDALRESLKLILKPVKMSIGKTWMALPQDAQKDEYVTTLKSSFVSVFAKSMDMIDGHLELSLKRIESISKENSLNSTGLLEKAEFSVKDSMLTDHCYEVGATKSLKSMKKPANASEIQADKKKFCIQSVIGALAHRLNDTQGLISMSMRFEAGAMSALQKKTKDATVHQLEYTA